MSNVTQSGSRFTSDAALDLYVTGLKNAHALEMQATQLLERQLERIESYPEVEQVLRRHLGETQAQIGRLNEILGGLGTQSSALKDLATSISGNLAAIAHSVMPDEILKNHFANAAFENFEIASYTSLIAMAEATGHGAHLTALQTTLQEEQNTAQTLHAMTAQLSLKYMQLHERGLPADR